MNALALAAELDRIGKCDAALMLRRQHEAIVKLREALDSCLTFMEPLSSDGQNAYENGNQALEDTEEL